MFQISRRPTLKRSSLPVVVFLGLVGTRALAEDNATGTVAGKVQLQTASPENTVVYLKEITGNAPTADGPALLDQEGKNFIPHLLPVRTGQRVLFTNSDSFNHNVHAYRGRRTLFNVIQSIDGEKDWLPPRSGVYLILCDIHSNMSAFVFAFDHSFFTTVDHGSGKSDFEIANIPEGSYTLVAVRDVDRKLVRKEQPVVIRQGEAVTVTFNF